MEKVAESSPTSAIPLESNILKHKTPPQNQVIEQDSPISALNPPKTGTPDRLKVPKAFKFTERYTSPTDQMMSPVSKGLLARTRKAPRLLPSSKTLHHHQIQESKLQQVGLFPM